MWKFQGYNGILEDDRKYVNQSFWLCWVFVVTRGLSLVALSMVGVMLSILRTYFHF